MNAPDPAALFRLESSVLNAAIDAQGAQLWQLRDPHGRDLLWNGDPAFWSGRAPVLFPIVGALNHGRYRWQGGEYALPRHGFARNRRFSLVAHAPERALFRLGADEQTRKVYPFDFELDMEFALEDAVLAVVATVRNSGTAPLPASLGLHPALRWPLPGAGDREAHFIEFEREEPAAVRRLDAAGLLRRDALPTPVRGRRLALSDALFAEDVLIFDALTSRSLTYGTGTGPCIRMDFPDATHLGLWTKPGAGFLCIEPWRGVADPAGFAGELDARPGSFLVPPGGSESLTMRIAYD